MTVLAFDLDGTLAPSKSTLPPRMANLLSLLLHDYQICVISGGTFEQFKVQLIDGLRADDNALTNLHLMPTCGTQYYTYKNGWNRMYAENFTRSEKRLIIDALDKGIDALGLHENDTYGPIIEDRGSQITFSALGQDIVARLGDDGVQRKKAWDPNNTKKQALRNYVAELIPMFEVHVGGETSVDVTKPGVDKAYGMHKLIEMTGVTPDDIIFYGDRLEKGGNDYPVITTGIRAIGVTDWEDTADKLQPYIKNKSI